MGNSRGVLKILSYRPISGVNTRIDGEECGRKSMGGSPSQVGIQESLFSASMGDVACFRPWVWALGLWPERAGGHRLKQNPESRK